MHMAITLLRRLRYRLPTHRRTRTRVRDIPGSTATGIQRVRATPGGPATGLGRRIEALIGLRRAIPDAGTTPDIGAGGSGELYLRPLPRCSRSAAMKRSTVVSKRSILPSAFF